MPVMDAERILAGQRGTVPRYTSYPTAPHFADQNGLAIARSRLQNLPAGEAVSLYLHIPFCDRLCWFCGCHTKHTLKYAPVEAYIGALIAELATVRETAGSQLRLAHLHLGGGSPSMLRRPDFERLSAALRENFDLGPETEISVEIDPSDVTDETLAGLVALFLGHGQRDLGVLELLLRGGELDEELLIALGQGAGEAARDARVGIGTDLGEQVDGGHPVLGLCARGGRPEPALVGGPRRRGGGGVGGRTQRGRSGMAR